MGTEPPRNPQGFYGVLGRLPILHTIPHTRTRADRGGPAAPRPEPVSPHDPAAHSTRQIVTSPTLTVSAASAARRLLPRKLSDGPRRVIPHLHSDRRTSRPVRHSCRTLAFVPCRSKGAETGVPNPGIVLAPPPHEHPLPIPHTAGSNCRLFKRSPRWTLEPDATSFYLNVG
jgi:hypothetical protein